MLYGQISNCTDVCQRTNLIEKGYVNWRKLAEVLAWAWLKFWDIQQPQKCSKRDLIFILRPQKAF